MYKIVHSERRRFSQILANWKQYNVYRYSKNRKNVLRCWIYVLVLLPLPPPPPLPLLYAVVEVYDLESCIHMYTWYTGTQLCKLPTNTWPMAIIGIPPSIKISCIQHLTHQHFLRSPVLWTRDKTCFHDSVQYRYYPVCWQAKSIIVYCLFTTTSCDCKLGWRK